MPVHPYDPRRDDQEEKEFPDVGDIIERIIRGSDNLRPERDALPSPVARCADHH